MRQRFSPGVRGRITSAHELDALELDPRLVGRPEETAVLNHLTQERDDALGAWKNAIWNLCYLTK